MTARLGQSRGLPVCDSDMCPRVIPDLVKLSLRTPLRGPEAEFWPSVVRKLRPMSEDE